MLLVILYIIFVCRYLGTLGIVKFLILQVLPRLIEARDHCRTYFHCIVLHFDITQLVSFCLAMLRTRLTSKTCILTY